MALRDTSSTLPVARPARSWWVLAIGGVVLAVAAVLAGHALGVRRFGADDAASRALVEAEVRTAIERQARDLEALVTRVQATADLGAILTARDTEGAELFTLLAQAQAADPSAERALTLYSSDHRVLAWSGRPSTIPSDRLDGPASLFVAPGPLGLRLVYVEPVTRADLGASAPRRVGTLAAEHVLSQPDGVPVHGAAGYAVTTSLGRVALRPRFEGAGAGARTGTFLVRAPSGELLVEGEPLPGEVAAARSRWRAGVWAIALGVGALTVLLAAVPVMQWRRRARRWQRDLGAVALLAGVLVTARLVAWYAVPAWALAQVDLEAPPSASPVVAVLHRSALDFLLSGVLATALVGVLATLVERGRVTLRRWRSAPWRSVGTGAGFLAMQVAAGAVAAALLVALEWLVAMTVRDFAYEVTYLALHPWTLGRLATLVGLLAWQAAACWALVLVFVGMLLSWRVRHAGVASWLVILACWIGPSLLLWRLLERRGWAAPQEPMLLVLVVAGATSWILARGLGWYRRGSQALRLTAALLAVVIPSLLLYPSLSYFATRRTEHLIERAYAPEAMAHPRALKARLDEAQVQVDRQPGLAARITALEANATPQTDAAFFIWQQTVLARERLTSAVELYDTTGRLVSRFALNFPEYAARTPQYHASRCDWETFGEAAPFGAEERRMLHAEKAVCEPDGRVAGSVVVHVMPDYDVLSFISAGSPYFELFRGERRGDSHPGGEVALVIYGWGRTVIYSSTARAWPLDEPLFRRIYQSRTPFWATLSGADADHRVFFANDRFGIYALDYPLPGLFDHFVHLAEVATLAALVFVVLVVGTGLVRRLAGADVQPGRRLLREIRTSFYRKLFLAFVGASVVPALVLALLIRSFVAARLRADVEDEAARTVAVAQRVVEETVALPPFSESGLAALNDDLMVWVSRVLNQSVNVFDGPHLVATSERDLFASGLLPTRVPDAIFRAIVLDRLPTYVGEDEMADVRYLLAAAPVRAAGPNAILTVPLALRQREIEREIDDLDRGVQLGALLFVLLGAGIGFWMAERIGDPVQRLTRASKRIAAGDLDARVSVRSADELQRLVESFNGMAVELQRQRSQLERTNRLEAWAEMARQVAHDIKNPLTPIQLSAEHLRRVHADTGEPLGPVLDACTTTILTQVRLLRQIAGEFSSFATTPAPRPVPTDVRELLGEVLQAYVTGLAGRVVTRLDVAADVPHVVVDRMLIGRAVTNVIENALHAMPNGGRLELQAVREGDMLAITVRDTGVGMDDEALARLFEPYFSTKAIGTGLGLTIARRNVELHGGSIAVDSRRGEGTTVTLRVPIAQAAASD